MFTYHQHSLLWEWASKLGSERHQADVTVIQQRMTESLKTHDEQVAPLLMEHILTAQRLAERNGKWRQASDLASSVGEAFVLFGYWNVWRELLERGLKAARLRSDYVVVSMYLGNLGNLAGLQGDYGKARKFHEESLATARSTGDLGIVASAQYNLGMRAHFSGDRRTAQTQYEEALKIALAQKEDGKLIANILIGLGNLALDHGDIIEAKKFFQAARERPETLKSPEVLAAVLTSLGTIADISREYEEARDFFQIALEICKSTGDRVHLSGALGNLGFVANEQGDYSTARKFLEEGLALARIQGQRDIEGSHLLNLGSVAENVGDMDVAEKNYGEARRVAVSLSASNDTLGKSLLGLGRVAAKRGKKAEARQYVDQAIQILQQLGNPAYQEVKQFRDSLGSAPDPVRCRKTCDEHQAKGELVVPIAECIQKLCTD